MAQEAPGSPDAQRDFIANHANIIDQALGMAILRQVHASCGDTPGVIGHISGRKEPYINLAALDNEMVERIYRMVLAQKGRVHCAGGAPPPPALE